MSVSAVQTLLVSRESTGIVGWRGRADISLRTCEEPVYCLLVEGCVHVGCAVRCVALQRSKAVAAAPIMLCEGAWRKCRELRLR